MSITKELAALVQVQAPQSREIIPPPTGYSKFQEQLIQYRKCYKTELFDEDCRRVPWGQRYDDLGRQIDRKNWKPVVKPSIGKIMVHTQQAYLVGADKFPSISLVSKDEIPYPGLDPLVDVNDPELAASLAQKRELQTFLDDLLKAARLQDLVEDAVLEGLTLKEQPILLRFYDGYPYYTLPDRLWCDWGYFERNPRELEWFEEKFFFKRKVQGKEKTFLYKKRIDSVSWAEWELEITDETKPNDQGEFEFGTPIYTVDHKLGFTPVSIVKFKASMFADEVIDNVKGYIEYRNNIMAGVSGNMDPQRVLLTKPKGPGTAGRPIEDDNEPLEKNALWELEGDSIQSFANDTEGYKVAQTDIAESKDDLYQAARILVIPPDNEQSGKALMVRLAPQIAENMRHRSDLGYALVDIVEKLVKGALKVRLKMPDLNVPTALNNFTVQLDWGQILPVTPESIQVEIQNVDAAVVGGYLSKRTARRYIAPFFNVEDIAEEEEQIEKEQMEAQQQQLDMQAAAFEMQNKEPKEDEDDD